MNLQTFAERNDGNKPGQDDGSNQNSGSTDDNSTLEFSDEQQAKVNELINETIAKERDKASKAQKALEDGFDDKLQKALDERERKAKLTADQLAQEELNKSKQSVEHLKAEMAKRDRLDFAKIEAQRLGLPIELANKFVGDTDENTTTNLTEVAEIINNTTQTKVDEKLAGGTQPKTGNATNTSTEKKFSDLSLDEKSQLFQDDPDEYNRLKKQS